MPVTAVSSTNYAHVKALQDRHDALSRQIEEAQKSPSTRDFFINQLKKQKLIVKEKLERFQGKLRESRQL